MSSLIEQNSYSHDLDYYFSEINIPNQKLVREIYDFFTTGEGARSMNALAMMNLSGKLIEYSRLHVKDPDHVISIIEALPLIPSQVHALCAAMIKWVGGYPIDFKNDDQQAFFLRIEEKFLSFPGQTPEKEFAKTNEIFSRYLRKLGHAATYGIRSGIPLNDLLTVLKDTKEYTVTSFDSFEKLFDTAVSNGVYGELKNKFQYTAKLAQEQFLFNEWLIDEKGWRTGDKDRYQQFLTKQWYLEFLEYCRKKQITEQQAIVQEKASWQLPPLVTDLIKTGHVAQDPETEVTPFDLIFISYSWDSEEHKERIRSFTDELRKSGENAEIDLMEMQRQTATQFQAMMLKKFNTARKVIVVLSDGYKQKADDQEGGVWFEFKIILDEIDRKPQKYILVAFEDFRPSLLPLGLANRNVLPIRNPDDFKLLLLKLRDIDQFRFKDVLPDKQKLEPQPIKPFFSKKEDK